LAPGADAPGKGCVETTLVGTGVKSGCVLGFAAAVVVPCQGKVSFGAADWASFLRWALAMMDCGTQRPPDIV